MARSAGDPRIRYIGFRVHTSRPLDRGTLIDAIRRTTRAVPGAEEAEPWLTRYDGALGIIRCRHTGADVTRRLLEAVHTVESPEGPVPLRLEPLQTAGTIRSLTEGRLGELRDAGRRR